MKVPLEILGAGLVTAVGLSAPTSCAAIRAKVSNPTETAFFDSSRKPIVAHQVPLALPWRGYGKLVRMAAMAIEECLGRIPEAELSRLPLLLCVAEQDRPGRLPNLDQEIFSGIQRELGIEFSPQSMVIHEGRISVATALAEARRLLVVSDASLVLIAASDSLLRAPTLKVYERARRLLNPRNSNGFIPGEGAAALLVGPPTSGGALVCAGLGFASEAAHISSEAPLRGDGLTLAIKDALGDAGCDLADLDFRVTDISGEQYYFKEAALALTRTLRTRRPEFPLWHPAECIGESGAVAGLAAMVVADAACRKGYSSGPGVLCHFASDAGQRAAAVLRFRAAQ